MEIITISLFCIMLAGSMAAGYSVIPALFGGLGLFLAYGLLRGFAFRELVSGALKSLSSIGKILFVFMLLGVLTAFWRAGGTIAAIICYALQLMRPEAVIVAIFLLNCGVSFLTGSSFGTAATIGVISLGISNSMGLPAFLAGGAMLSGAYFGDRCSPVSTSALLVSTLTWTRQYANIKNMLRSAAVPFVLSCGVYAAAGYFLSAKSAVTFDTELLRSAFQINLFCLVPALLVLLLALFRVDIRITLCMSSAAAFMLAMALQGETVCALLRMAVLGYRSSDAAISALMDGGGIVSMLKCTVIVGTACCYAGIFEMTGLLNFIKAHIGTFARKFGNYTATLIVSIVTAAVSCNQTLSIMLTHQLCSGFETTPEEKALNLADSAVIVSPLIPWCIAGAIPLAITGAPQASLFAACYLWLLPLWRLLTNRNRMKDNRSSPRFFEQRTAH